MCWIMVFYSNLCQLKSVGGAKFWRQSDGSLTSKREEGSYDLEFKANEKMYFKGMQS